MKLSNVKISSRIISSYIASKCLILKDFDQHNEVIIHCYNVFPSRQTGGAKPKTGGAITLPAPTWNRHWLYGVRNDGTVDVG